MVCGYMFQLVGGTHLEALFLLPRVRYLQLGLVAMVGINQQEKLIRSFGRDQRFFIFFRATAICEDGTSCHPPPPMAEQADR